MLLTEEAHPAIAHVRVRGPAAPVSEALRVRIEEIVSAQLGRLSELQKELVDGRIRIDRWPLRA